MPRLEMLADKEKEYQFFKIDADSEPQLLSDFFISSLPTIIAMKDGKEIVRRVGKESCQDFTTNFNSIVW